MLQHHRDDVATREKGYEDPRSFVSYAGHEYLSGKDVGKRRKEVRKRDGNRCVRCGEYVTEDQMEMDHIQGGIGPQRCWCLHNLQTLCHECHTKKHGRTVRLGGL